MFTKTIIAASALAAAVSAQGVTAVISPTQPAPAGCTGTGSGKYNIAVVNVTTAGGMKFAKRQDGYPYSGAEVLEMTLTNGVLTDNKGRIGYIAANEQFQFDGPPQTGAIYTAGFSACANGTLALGDSAVWYECLSGTFYNLYDESQGAQCQEIFIDLLPVTASTTSAGAAGQSTDGQVTAATSTSAVSQITDGQIQATTPASSLATTSVSKVSQITDGQIQATTAASSLATTKSSVPVVSQITDGQIQATTAASSLRASTTSSVALVSQITDGQIQATTPASVAPYTGAASIPTAAAQLFLGAAAVAAYVL